MATETPTPIATHTPGPWEVGDNGVSILSSALKGIERWTDDNGGEHEYEKGLIALVYSCRPRGDWSLGHLDANRRLIAASPKMADLLKRLRGWDHLDGAADGPYWKREIDALLAEIEGRS